MAKDPEILPAIRNVISDHNDMKVRIRLERALRNFDLSRVKGQKDIAARYAFLADVMAECGLNHPEVRPWCNDLSKLLKDFTDSHTKWISTELPQELADTIGRLEEEHARLLAIMRDEINKETYETIMRRFDIERPR